MARPHETDQAGRLERGLFLGGLLFGPALGALLAYVSHPWWLHGSGSFAAAYDFVGGIAFGGVIGLVVVLLVADHIGRVAKGRNESR